MAVSTLRNNAALVRKWPDSKLIATAPLDT
jgi:hypothetical protein